MICYRIFPRSFTPAMGAFVLAGVALFCAPQSAHADTLLFQDNFDAGNSAANWTTNKSGTDSFVDYAFDYSTIGLPSAPHSTGGTTIGTRFLVNQGDPANNGTTTTTGVFQGISASPTAQSFTGDFKIQFDAWLNYVGPLTAGGSGSTQMASFGWGTNGTTAQWAGSSNGILFAGSSDGGTTQDYRAYRNNALLSPTTGSYAAGTDATGTATDARNNSNSYYSTLGGKTAPAAQVSLFPNQTGTTPAGTMGMAWRDMVIERSGNTLAWTVDGLRIATVDTTSATLAGSNLFLGMFDINATSSTDPNDFLNAAIYDNLTVTQIAAVPEPSTWAMMVLGCIGLGVTGWRRKRSEAKVLNPQIAL